MSVPLRFGYKASSEQFGPNELLEFGVLAEEVGFDSVFLSDHLQPWMHDGGHAPNALPWLGALGARTDASSSARAFSPRPSATTPASSRRCSRPSA